MSDLSSCVVFVDGNFVTPRSGSHARFASAIHWLLSRDHRVVVYSYRNHPSAPWDQAAIDALAQKFPGCKLVLDDYSAPLALAYRAKNLCLKLFPALAKNILRVRLPNATPEYDRLVDRENPGVVLLNFVESMTLLNGVTFSHTYIDTHDLKFVKHMRRAHLPVSALSVLLKMRAEFACLQQCDGVITISAAEDAVFRLLLDPNKVFFVPAFPTRHTIAAPANEQGYTYDLLFVGSDYTFNVSGICDFLRNNKRWLSDYRIAVAGTVCNARELRELAPQFPQLQLLGYTDDLGALYRSSKFALSPVNGTGLKMKIVDALAHGVPVFASAQSLEGLPAGHESSVFSCEEATMVERLKSPMAAFAELRRAAATYHASFQQTPDLQRLGSALAGLRHNSARSLRSPKLQHTGTWSDRSQRRY